MTSPEVKNVIFCVWITTGLRTRTVRFHPSPRPQYVRSFDLVQDGIRGEVGREGRGEALTRRCRLLITPHLRWFVRESDLMFPLTAAIIASYACTS